MLIYVTIDIDNKTINVSEESENICFEYRNENFTSITIKDIIEGVKEGYEIWT